MNSAHEPTVISGAAAITANGADTDAVWKAVLSGSSGLAPLTRFDGAGFPLRVAGEVPDAWAVTKVPSKLAVQTDRWTQLALTLSERALDDGSVIPAELSPYEMAVVTASSSGGNEFGQKEIQALWRNGPEEVGPYQSIAWFYAATTGQLSIRHGIKGPCGVIAAEQAGGLDAIDQARRFVRQGTRIAITGGTEAPIGPYALACQLSSGLLSAVTDPALAYVAFDETSSGYVPGEGGAILVTEKLSHARARGAEAYSEIAGYAATFDGPQTPRLNRAIELAMADAKVHPQDVDVVFADALGITDADTAEADALAEVFGPRAVAVAAPKTLFGRLYAGGPAVDVVLASLAMRDGVIPPAVEVRPAGRTAIDLVTEPRESRVRTAVVVARGFGGFNSALVLRAV